MAEQQKILILTSKTGGGHVSLAEALRDQLAEGNPIIEIIDPQSRFIHWHYRMVSRYALWLWSAEFQLMNTPVRAHIAHQIFALLVRRPLERLLKRFQPDLILTTYPFLTFEVMEALRKGTRPVPFGMLFTDPQHIHASWLTEKRADITFAPTAETYQQALQAGFPPEKLHQVGWPVRLQFTQNYESQRLALFSKMGLDPACFTLFVQGGGEGAAQFGETINRVLHIDERIQIILATGTNQALLTRFQGHKRLFPLPFTKEIAPYMAVSDLIMGKAGPNMLFEAVTLGKPFLATAYIPGQEEANLEFIQRHGLGWIALTAGEQVSVLTSLLHEPTRLRQMIDSVQAYRQRNIEACNKIPFLMKELIPVPSH
ncbi:MGDG synthase family glycosyltransferase [Tengunoibacter tsumagoiensis]|uniref:Galactosyldiacylglycerol synthase n=1 Tax=Tengunoibacter tsumagoiensis TaxID=2014871 RepID=A0A401ZTZ9_9CHLR|nr:glycosyltransferase [Tengunoibacter tsumagoiensis]GCE10244.1 galactosyldiacylglycerol synthase [Tengunoibacter tsumagoiensis]